MPTRSPEGNAYIFQDVQQVYIVLEGRELLNHEVVIDAKTGQTQPPTGNDTKFFAIKQVLAEYDEANAMDPGLNTF